MASGIKDKVVILGMGCSKFGERWDSSSSDLMVEAFEECIADAGIEKNQIEAAWFGAGIDTFNVGSSAMPLAIALRLNYIPVTKVENMFAKLKDWRRIAMRFDRCAHAFLSAIQIAAVVIFWINQ